MGFLAKIFFLARIIVAGVYGARPLNQRILFVRTAPAALGLVLVLLA